MMFLTRDELKQLTGYKRPSAIRRWLGQNGYEYEVARDGYPRVLSDAVTKKLGGESTRSSEWQPSLLRH